MPGPASALHSTHAERAQPPRAVGERERTFIGHAIRDVAPGWCVELCGVTPADQVLAVMPEDADDRFGPTFVIQAVSGGFLLEQLRHDELLTVARRAELSEVAAILRAHVAGQVLFVTARPITLH